MQRQLVQGEGWSLSYEAWHVPIPTEGGGGASPSRGGGASSARGGASAAVSGDPFENIEARHLEYLVYLVCLVCLVY